MTEALLHFMDDAPLRLKEQGDRYSDASMLERLQGRERENFLDEMESRGRISPRKDGMLKEFGQGVVYGGMGVMHGLLSTAEELGFGSGMRQWADDVMARNQQYAPYKGYSGFSLNPTDIARTVGTGAAQSVGSMAVGAGATIATGNPAVGTAAMTAFMFGQIYGDRVKEYRDVMRGVPDGQVKALALLSSVGESLIESYIGPEQAVVKLFGKSAGEKAVGAAVRGLVKKVGKDEALKMLGGGEATAELAKIVGKDVSDQVLGKAVKKLGQSGLERLATEAIKDFAHDGAKKSMAALLANAAKKVGKEAAIGYLTEGSEEVSQMYWNELVKAMGTHHLELPSWQEVAEEFSGGAWTGLFMGGGEQMLSSFMDRAADRRYATGEVRQMGEGEAVPEDAKPVEGEAATSPVLSPEEQAARDARKSMAEKVATMSGMDVVWLTPEQIKAERQRRAERLEANGQATEEAANAPVGGWYHYDKERGKGTAFINPEDTRGVDFVIGHELYHDMMDSEHGKSSGIGQAVRRVIREAVKGKEKESLNPAAQKLYERIQNLYTEYKAGSEDFNQEFEADIWGHLFTDNEFMTDLGAELERRQQGLGVKFIEAIRDFVGRIIDAIKGDESPESSRLLNEYEQTREALAKLAADYTETNVKAVNGALQSLHDVLYRSGPAARDAEEAQREANKQAGHERAKEIAVEREQERERRNAEMAADEEQYAREQEAANAEKRKAAEERGKAAREKEAAANKAELDRLDKADEQERKDMAANNREGAELAEEQDRLRKGGREGRKMRGRTRNYQDARKKGVSVPNMTHPDGSKVPEGTIYAVVDAAKGGDIVTSYDGEGYDQALQNSDTGTQATELIGRHSDNPNAALMLGSDSTSQGIPVVDPDTGDVVIHNTGVMIRRMMAEKGTDKEYNEKLRETAKRLKVPFPEDARQPMLVAYLPEGMSRDAKIEQAKKGNLTTTRSVDAGQRAAADATLFATDDGQKVLSMLPDADSDRLVSEANSAFVKAAYAMLAKEDGDLVDGRPTDKFNDRLENAMMSLIFSGLKEEDRVRLVGDLVNDARNLGLADFKSALAVKAAKLNLIALKNKDFDLRPELSKSTRDIVKWKRSGMKFAGDYANQLNFDPKDNMPEADKPLFLALGNASLVSAKAVRQVLDAYIDGARAELQGQTLIGDKVTKATLVQRMADASADIISSRKYSLSDAELKSAAKQDGIDLDKETLEFRDVYARYRDTKQWMKAPNGKDSKLTARQWVQVRTPSFKKWAGDWESATKFKQIENLAAIPLRQLPIDEDIRTIYGHLENGINENDGLEVRFVNSTLGKILRHKGFNTALIIPQLKQIYDKSVPLGFQIERQQPPKADGRPHKTHTNFIGYHNYLGKISLNGKEYYVRFTVQELNTHKKDFVPNEMHSTYVSDVEIINADLNAPVNSQIINRATDEQIGVNAGDSLSQSTASAGERENYSDIDNILMQYLKDFKSAAEKSTKVVDENGEPMVVYHGTKSRFYEFTDAKMGKGGAKNNRDGNLYGNGYYFTDDYYSAQTYGRRVLECFLNIRNPSRTSTIGPENDGLMVNSGFHKTCLATNPTQIKSATDNIGTFSSEDPDIRYSLVADSKINEEFNEDGKYITTYRSALLGDDGKLYPPMATKGGEGMELGKAYKSEEHPELINKKGKFPLKSDMRDSGERGSVAAAYNPYFHSQPGVLNDQFSVAYDKSRMVTVKCRVLKSDIESGYQAEGAKDPVGYAEWATSGPVTRQMRGRGGRSVILSRYIMPVEIVPDAEVARKIKDYIGGQDVTVPWNVVTPSLRGELEKAGVKVGSEADFREAEMRRTKKRYSLITKEEDAAYMDAVQRGDMETAQKMVDDAAEQMGYDDGQNYAYADTKHNRKLLAAVTYDDEGNVIPAEKRLNWAENDVRYSLLGEKGAAALDHVEAQTTRMDNLETARQMLKAGKDALSIRLATGWELGPDKKWRYEISDKDYEIDNYGLSSFKENNPEYVWMREQGMKWIDGREIDDMPRYKRAEKKYSGIERKQVEKLKNNQGRLDDIVSHPELFKAYPELREVGVMFVDKDEMLDYSAAYSPATNEILLPRTSIPFVIDKKNLIHEIQHAIQQIEGFAKGGAYGEMAWVGDMRQHTIKEYERILKEVQTPKTLEEYAREAWGSETITDAIRKAYKGYLTDVKKLTPSVIQQLQKQAGINTYRKISGEVEARNVESRAFLNSNERQARTLESTEDVPRDKQIIRYSLRRNQSNPIVSDGKVRADYQELLDNGRYTPEHVAEWEAGAVQWIRKVGGVENAVGLIVDGLEPSGKIGTMARRLVMESDTFKALPQETQIKVDLRNITQGTEWGREGAARRISSLTLDSLPKVKAVIDAIRSKLTPEQRDKMREDVLRDTGIDLDKLPDDIHQDREKLDHLITATLASKATTKDKLYEYWVNAILSAPMTHVANTVGNLANLAYELGVKRLAEAAVNHFAKRPDAARFSDFRAMWASVDWKNAWRSAVQAFNIEVLDASGKYVEGAAPAIEGKKGRIIRIPGRFLRAADEFAKAIIVPIETAAMADRLGRQQNLVGAELDAFIKRQLRDADSEAAAYGRRRSLELTFQEDPGKIVTTLVALKNGDSRWATIVKYLFPFMKTPYNLLRQGIRKSPLGAISLLDEGVDILRGKRKADSDFIAHAAEQVVAWSLVGMALAMGGGDNDDEPPRLIGSSKGGAAGERMFRGQHVPAYSIRIGDKYYSYKRIEPLSTMLALIADDLESYRMAKTEEGASKALRQMFTGTARLIGEKSYLNTFSQIVQLFDEPERSIGSWTTDFAASWMPNAVRQASNAFDDVRRDPSVRTSRARWWKDQFHLTLSKAGVMRMAPKVDCFGRPITKDDAEKAGPGDILWRLLVPANTKSADAMDPAEKVIWNWNIRNLDEQYWPGVPSYRFSLDGVKYEMHGKDYADFSMESGRAAHRRILELINTGRINPGNPREEDIAMIKQALNVSRKLTRQKYVRLHRCDKVK